MIREEENRSQDTSVAVIQKTTQNNQPKFNILKILWNKKYSTKNFLNLSYRSENLQQYVMDEEKTHSL